MPDEQPGTLRQIGDLTIRLMRDEPGDYRLMARWLTDDRVLEFYEGRDRPQSYDRVLAKYGPRVRGEDPVPCILVYQEREIGYLQYYPVASPEEYGLDDATGTYAIDLFIGEPEYWGRGLGSRALSALVAYMLEELDATRIVIDPRVDNHRAIRSYEKCGFRKVKLLAGHELHEGSRRDCWLMTIEAKAALAP